MRFPRLAAHEGGFIKANLECRAAFRAMCHNRFLNAAGRPGAWLGGGRRSGFGQYHRADAEIAEWGETASGRVHQRHMSAAGQPDEGLLPMAMAIVKKCGPTVCATIANPGERRLNTLNDPRVRMADGPQQSRCVPRNKCPICVACPCRG